jgi:mono/diheme cytochrome c family protein
MNLSQTFLPAFALIALASLHAAEAPCVVPGFERLRASGGDWQSEAGEVLFSELSCAACHRDGATEKSSFAWKAGPDLSAAGDRLRANYVRSFLADPGSVKPGTTMPNLFAGMSEPRKAELIEDLTHHLMGQRAKRRSTVEPIVGNAKTGRELFLSVGCVACHGAQPMERLGEKYAPGELARFLLAPLSARPSGRMPEQRLGKKDAAHLAAFLAPKPPLAEAEFVVDPERAQRGRKAFASIGCVACHGKGELVKPPPPLGDLQRGCLAAEPKAGVPHYPLTDEQRGAIRAALVARGKSSGADDPKTAIRRIMLQRNCFACHARGGLGGPAPDVAVHFTSTKDDLGDLGRLPPPLDGVGRKIQRAALENVLRGREPVRSYMRVKMPGFGDDLTRELSKLFATADADPNERPSLAREKDPNLIGTSEWGRELVGIKGYACIACHDINRQASLGIGAYDLAEMPKRLRPEWMRDFLLNPASFPTGARMPLFWPEGKPMNPSLGGGTAERQIDSIRRYLAEVDESLPPEGLAARAALVLEPKEKPVIFRTFLKGAGTHALAVGFPGGVNVAFDALAVRWSMAWRGGFLDADGTWNQRYVKMEQPLGEALVRLEDAGALSIVGHDEITPRFRGYHVGKDGVPIFDYDLGALRIEDRVEPTPNRGLRRTLRISGQTNEAMQFSAPPPAGVKLQVAGGAALPVRLELEFREGNAELVEEIAW